MFQKARHLYCMVVNVVELLHITVQVKLSVSRMDRRCIDLFGLGIVRPPVTGSLDLHAGYGLLTLQYTIYQRIFLSFITT